MTYRADIDGLRAVAVLVVVLYHLGLPAFPGGFVGVDVFFVISGYLITSIILTELRAGTFTLTGFYERRARRILPALFAMVAVTTVVGAVVLVPSDFRDLGRSAVATVLFVSNHHFFSQAGYFEGPSEAKPLLHTWSLAVEEQYYLVVPALMMIVWRAAPSRIAFVVVGLLAASFAFAVHQTARAPQAAFFLTPARLWELLLGAGLALKLVPPLPSRAAREIAAAAGLALIAASVALYSGETPFPGLAAVPPCLGAALLIHAHGTGTTVVGHVLRLRPSVAIGTISYSLYLWHWPVIVLAKYHLDRPLTTAEAAIAAVVMLALATASWRWVEQPFRRRGTGEVGTRAVWTGAGAAAAVLLAGGAHVAATDGWRWRQGAEMTAVETDARWPARQSRCTGACARLGLRDMPPRFVLVGDSHAAALIVALDEAAAERGVAGRYVDSNGCPPIRGIERVHVASTCRATLEATITGLEPSIEVVILAARWEMYVAGPRPGCVDDCLPPRTIRSVDAPSAPRIAAFRDGLTRVVDDLVTADRHVVILRQVPEQTVMVPQHLTKALWTGRPLDMAARGRTRTDVEAQFAAVEAVITEVGGRPGVTVVDPRPTLCPGTACPLVLHGRVLYRDDDHVSVPGARLVTAPIMDAVTAALATGNGSRR
jgi:peptidoglycan/LPS O-acetylase OafA/YrhL